MALKDFTTFTEDDPNDRITVATRRVTWASLTRNELSGVYLDKGASYFSGDFTHLITVTCTAAAVNSGTYFWILSNATGISGGGRYLEMSFANSGGTLLMRLAQRTSGKSIQASDQFSPFVLGTTYYLRIVLDDSFGTYGKIYCYIYSDAARTTPVDTLSVVRQTAKDEFRYIFACGSTVDAVGATNSGYSENLSMTTSIQKAAVTTQPVSAITSTAATGNGTIVNIGLSSVTEHGFVVDTTIDPKTSADGGTPVVETTKGAGTEGVFTSSMSNLLEGQKYFVRAYATNTEGTAYGANATFISGGIGTQLIEGNLAVVQTGLHYVDASGKERYLTGTLV